MRRPTRESEAALQGLRATFEPLTCGRALLGHWDGNDLPASPSAGPTKPRTGNLFAVSNNASPPRPFAKPHGAGREGAHFGRLWTMIQPDGGHPLIHAHQLTVFALDHPASGRYRLRFWA